MRASSERSRRACSIRRSCAFRALLSSSRVSSVQNEIAHKIEKQIVENIESVRVVHEISEQHVVLEKKVIVVAALDEQEAVLQHFVRFAKIVAEKRAPRFREDALFHFAPDTCKRFAHLAENVLPVRLNFGDFRAHHVRLLAVLESSAARANPFLALDQRCSKTGSLVPS